MDLNKTSILPSGSEAACKELRRLIHDRPEVLFVVLGAAGRDALLTKAGLYAGGPNDLRWVVWAQRPDEIADVIIGELKGAQQYLTLLPAQAVAFTLSYSDTVADVIRADETIDNVRVVQAYLQAEATP